MDGETNPDARAMPRDGRTDRMVPVYGPGARGHGVFGGAGAVSVLPKFEFLPGRLGWAVALAAVAGSLAPPFSTPHLIFEGSKAKKKTAPSHPLSALRRMRDSHPAPRDPYL